VIGKRKRKRRHRQAVSDIFENEWNTWEYLRNTLTESLSLSLCPIFFFFSCFYNRFDDTDVSVMRYNYYGDVSDKYPTTIEIRYPKSGTNNPRVRLFVYNLREKTESQVKPPVDIPETRYESRLFFFRNRPYSFWNYKSIWLAWLNWKVYRSDLISVWYMTCVPFLSLVTFTSHGSRGLIATQRSSIGWEDSKIPLS